MYIVIQTLNVALIVLCSIGASYLGIKKVYTIVSAHSERNAMIELIMRWICGKLIDIPIKIKVLDGGKMPERKHKGDAGFDCYARLDGPVVIEPKTVKIIPLGFCLELPENWYADVRPRSGLAAKNHVVAQLGLIDEPYRNELGGIISNFSDEPFTVNNGDRICQVMCHEAAKYKFVEVETLSTTDRGEGFGSSGI